MEPLMQQLLMSITTGQLTNLFGAIGDEYTNVTAIISTEYDDVLEVVQVAFVFRDANNQIDESRVYLGIDDGEIVLEF